MDEWRISVQLGTADSSHNGTLTNDSSWIWWPRLEYILLRSQPHAHKNGMTSAVCYVRLRSHRIFFFALDCVTRSLLILVKSKRGVSILFCTWTTAAGGRLRYSLTRESSFHYYNMVDRPIYAHRLEQYVRGASTAHARQCTNGFCTYPVPPLSSSHLELKSSTKLKLVYNFCFQ